jgi:hypothetical protein
VKSPPAATLSFDVIDQVLEKGSQTLHRVPPKGFTPERCTHAGSVPQTLASHPTRENTLKRMFRRLTRARAALIGVGTVTIAVAITGLIAQSGTAAALPSSGSGQWPMAGQNISDTHFQAAEHVISPANVSRLTPRAGR